MPTETSEDDQSQQALMKGRSASHAVIRGVNALGATNQDCSI